MVSHADVLPGMTRHVHLDPVGGMAGDMFIAAVLDAFSELTAGAIEAAERVAHVKCALLPHKDHVLAGARFRVEDRQSRGHEHASHVHARWADIRARIEASGLEAAVKAHAVGIFTALARAEGKIHGTSPEQVTFHEVGAADSIADIVAVAWLIHALGPATWSVGPLPLGSGMIMTAHGPLPVPAPATALLLRGLRVVDDGVPGERVTPTGAAILRHLGCGVRPGGLRMAASGTGFGTRTLPNLSNCLRLLAFDRVSGVADPGVPHRSLVAVTFEVDDQSAEDLSVGLERLRGMSEVHDVLMMPAYGKKGRMTNHIQVLAAAEAEEAVVAACFAQTTTIGLRTQIVSARALPRRTASVALPGGSVRVKLAERPGGATVKAELDDLAQADTHAARARLRRLAEDAAR